ncbi:MAG: element excision factor XisH family protein [Chloroflexota bacterium]
MPRRDRIHKHIKNALTNDDWTITADPYHIRFEDKTLEADMKADKFIAVTRQNISIVIEVKSFLQTSFIHEFLEACGQYQGYRILMGEMGETNKLYMALGNDVYEREFSSATVQLLIKRIGIHLLIVDTKEEVIVQWIEQNE